MIRRAGARRRAERVNRAADRGALDLLEPGVDALPAGRDEIDEQGEIVDACVALGEQVALEPLEPADRLVQQAADLGDVPRDREHLGPQAVVHGGADLLRQHALELGRGLGQSLDLGARALERGFELGGRDAAGRRCGDPLFRPLECALVHGCESTLAVGWMPASSTTTCRRS